MKKKKTIIRPKRLFKKDGQRYIISNNRKVLISSELPDKELLKFLVEMVMSDKIKYLSTHSKIKFTHSLINNYIL